MKTKKKYFLIVEVTATGERLSCAEFYSEGDAFLSLRIFKTTETHRYTIENKKALI